MSDPMYVSSAFVGEMLRELLLALSGLKYGTMTFVEVIGVYDLWLEKLAEEVGCTILDDPDLVKKGEN